jgi:hypothetical protein
MVEDIEKALVAIRGNGEIRLRVRMGQVIRVTAHKSAPSQSGFINLAVLVAFMYLAYRAYTSGGFWSVGALILLATLYGLQELPRWKPGDG